MASPKLTDTREQVHFLQLQAQVKDLEFARKKLLLELADKDKRLAAVGRLRESKPIIEAKRRPHSSHKTRQGTPVLLCSDWHVEEPVDPKKVGGLNSYNLAIADRCILELAEAFVWLSEDKRFDTRVGVVWLGGDLYSGYIHEELQESNFLSPVQAVVWLQGRIIRMLTTILESGRFDRVIVVCNDGNHGRLTHKIRISTRTANSLEWLLYQTLAAHMASEPRIEFQIAEGEYNFLKVYKQVFGFCHGDSYKAGGGVGGIMIPLRKGLNELRKYRQIDHMSMGHFHQYTTHGDLTVNGSMIGIGPYSMSIHAAPEPRQQAFFMVDSERGKCVSAPVWLPK